MNDRSANEELPLVEVDTTVSKVTFFEDRAEVLRVARCRLPRGRSRVRARGVTLLADDRSLTCAVRDRSAQVVSCRIRRQSEDVAGANAEETRATEAELERANVRLGLALRGLEEANAEGRRAAAMMKNWGDVVGSVPSRADAAAAELGRAYDAIDRAQRAALDAGAGLQRERTEAKAEVANATDRLAQARARRPRFEAFAEIEMAAERDAEIDVEITYRTPCALWRPEHLARLSRDDAGGGEITLTTYAAVWQLTGEDWSDVACCFSTARPARGATAPPLREDVLVTRRKTDAERSQVLVEAREQAIATAGLSRGTRDVDEMPGVEDGGEPQWLLAPSRATIASDGHPVRVEVGQRRFRCTVARVSLPELGSAVHLCATATLPGPAPLLAGPVTVGRETEIVGRGVVTFVGAGEPFELGFGVDDGLRVRRRVVEKRKTTPVTGTQHVAREVHLYVSNLGSERRSLSIRERVPVSEVEEVEVILDPQPKMRRDERDGFATLDVDLPGRATREIKLTYRIEAKSNVVLPPSFDA